MWIILCYCIILYLYCITDSTSWVLQFAANRKYIVLHTHVIQSHSKKYSHYLSLGSLFCSFRDSAGVVFTILLCLAEWLDLQATNYLVRFWRISLTVLLQIPNCLLKSSCLGFGTASLSFISSIFFSKVSCLCPLCAIFPDYRKEFHVTGSKT